MTGLVKRVFSRLRPKQQANEILDVQFVLPDGTRIYVQSPHQDSKITIVQRGDTVELTAAQQTADASE